jgi:hypothetical protein
MFSQCRQKYRGRPCIIDRSNLDSNGSPYLNVNYPCYWTLNIASVTLAISGSCRQTILLTGVTLSHRSAPPSKLRMRIWLLPAVAPDQRAQQGIGELAPNGGTDLPDLLHRRQAVEPCHQRVVQRRRDGERRQRPVESIALGVLD